MSRYVPSTESGRRQMLRAIGASSIEELFEDVPARFRLARPLRIEGPMSEPEVMAHLAALASRNRHDMVSFLGGGANRHFVPSVIDYLLQRGEFLTAYTPYQPELSQGTLQALYEFQTFVALLTGMDIANGSLYDGATSVVEAVLMARRLRGEGAVAVSRALNPQYREVLAAYLEPLGMRCIEVPLGDDGLTDMAAAGVERACCVVIQQPNFLGLVEDVSSARREADRLGALLVVATTEPLAFGIIRPPGEFGADVVVGEGQSLGVPLQLGGPYLGIFATKKDYTRQVPGRLVGLTRDVEGREGFVITLATREQHIRRARATSNICTNETLLAMGASMFLALLGPHGLRDLAVLNLNKAAFARESVAGIDGFELPFPAGTHFNEFPVRCTRVPVRELLSRLEMKRIAGGIALDRWYPELADCFLVSVTETNTREEIEALARALEECSR